MSPIRIVPLLAGLACAMPIHVGSSWTWRLVDLRTNAISYRSARIVDSIPGDTTTLWRVAVIDSPSGMSDTARLITTRGGEQNWAEGSPLFPVEPLPESASTSMLIPEQGGLYARMWGEVAFASLIGNGGDFVEDFTLTSGCGMLAIRMDGSYKVGGGATYVRGMKTDAPFGVWSDTLGVERFRIQQQDWRLIRANGRDLAIADSLAIPDSGATRLWKVVTTRVSSSSGIIPGEITSTTTMVSWTIQAKLPDSAGWVRLRMAETIAPAMPREFDLRLNRFTGERIPARQDAIFLPDDFWRRDLSDVDSGAYRFRSTIVENRVEATIGSGTTVFVLARAGRSGDLDSLHHSTSNVSTTGGTTTSSSSVTTTATLLSVDGKEVGNRLTAVGPRASRGTSRIALAELVRTTPDAVVHWSDVAGRRGTTTLARFMSSRPASGVLHLSIPLPDGTRWEGTSLNLR